MKITVDKLGEGDYVKLRCDTVPPESFRTMLKGRGWRWKKPSGGLGYWLGEKRWIPTDEIRRLGWDLWVFGEHTVSGASGDPGHQSVGVIKAEPASTVPEPTRDPEVRRVFQDPTHTSQRPIDRNFYSACGRSTLTWLKKLNYLQLRTLAKRYDVNVFTTYRRSEIILEPENLAAAIALKMKESSFKPVTAVMVMTDLDTDPSEIAEARLYKRRDLPPSLRMEKAWKKFLADGGQVNKEVRIPEEQLSNEVNKHVKHRASECYGIVQEAINAAAKECWDPDLVKKQTTEAVEKAVQEVRPVVYNIVSAKKTVTLTSVTLPEEFGRIVRKLAIGLPVMLVGPTGCGKTFVASQAAKALEMDFGALSCSIGAPDSAITGLLLPTGTGGKFEYVPSEFVRLYENGGLFLIDEMDNADANWLVLFNMALSGTDGFFLTQRYEKPFVKRHPDFVCMAAANTYGTGTDLQYVGRSQLDEATLDRFRAGTIYMDYNPTVEESLVDAEILEWGRKVRTKLSEHRLRRNLSTRVLQQFTQEKAAYPDHFSMKEMEQTFTLGWSEDERRKVTVA